MNKELALDILLIATLAWFADIIIPSNKKVSFKTNKWTQSIDSDYVKWIIKDEDNKMLNKHYESFISKKPDCILTREECKELLKILSKWVEKIVMNFLESWSSDFSYTLKSELAEYWVFSYRINSFKNRAWMWFVIRVLPDKELPYEVIWLPKELIQSSQNEKSWLIIVTWPTWSWKTTTLISMLSLINTHLNKHVVTIEDPVEFIYPDSWRSIFQQREVWSDTESFHKWLMDALRQAPDIIVIWELRDAETIKIALDAASTWHLVFATFHAWSAVETIEWVIERSWSEEAKHMISSSLVAVLAQKLIKYEDEATWKWKRQTVLEYLSKSTSVSALVKWPKDQLKQLNSELLKKPNQSLESNLFKMVFEFKISYSEAFNNMKNKVSKLEDYQSKIMNYIKVNKITRKDVERANKLEIKRNWENSRLVLNIK